MPPMIDAVLDPGTPRTVRYTGKFTPPVQTSLSELAAGIAVLIMGAFVLFVGGMAIGHIIKPIMEAV